MTVRRVALITVHASPLALLGSRKAGGMNVYIRELARELGERGIEVDIYTRRTSDDQLEIDYSIGKNVRVIHIVSGGVRTLGPDDIYTHLSEFAAGMIAFATRAAINYDIIYSHYWLSGWVANKLREVWGTPFVHMFHTLGQMKNRIQATGPSILPDTRITVETRVMDWADAVIAATPAEHAQLLWLYRGDRRKIHIVSPGVNLERFRPVAPDVARQQLGIDEQTKLLLFVGRIEPLKAVDTVLHALAILKETDQPEFDDIRFVVIGGSPDDPHDAETQRLIALTEELDLSQHVQFLGARAQESLPLYYGAATSLIVPSDYESFGMVALEAMASGTPVIASEVGGLAFLVRDGETGYLVPSRDPHQLAERILRVVSNTDQYSRMRAAAANLALHYAWSVIADQLLDIFSSVLQRYRANRHKSWVHRR